jgi:hypothetical protein
MLPLLLELMPGEPLPAWVHQPENVACALVSMGFVGVFRADHLSPEELTAFASRPITLSVADVGHPFLTFIEAWVETDQGQKPISILFPHSAPLHEQVSYPEPVQRSLKRGTRIHIIAFQGSPETIVAVRRATFDERTVWQWHRLMERQVKATKRILLGNIWKDMETLLDGLPRPLPDRFVRASQVLPAPTEDELRFCIRRSEWVM